MTERKQVGAIAYRNDGSAGLRILLVTSRETGRWVIPKGWPMKSRRPHQAAAQEAFEEAGVQGSIQKKSAGSYRYPKVMRNGDIVECRVKVFPLNVERIADTWPEAEERRREWFSADAAAAAVEEPELAAILRAFEAVVRPSPKAKSASEMPGASNANEPVAATD